MTERRYRYPCGTRQQYTSGRCRCPACRRANADYMAHRRAELKAQATPAHAHGTPAGATYYGCCCGDCRAVANDRKREWKATRTTPEAVA